MFKKTVYVMAVVMMASSAFAANERDAGGKERERQERDAKAKDQAGGRDQAVSEEIRTLVAKSPIANKLGPALKKAGARTMVIDGKSLSMESVIDQTAEVVERVRRDPKKDTAGWETAETVATQYIALTANIRPGASGRDVAVTLKEASLIPDILSKYTPAQRDAHIAKERKQISAEKAMKEAGAKDPSLDQAAGKAFTSDEETKVIGCDKG